MSKYASANSGGGGGGSFGAFGSAFGKKALGTKKLSRKKFGSSQNAGTSDSEDRDLSSKMASSIKNTLHNINKKRFTNKLEESGTSGSEHNLTSKIA